jgi:AraC-like DNA-binding protein
VIVTEFRTEDLPVAERFGFWHDMTADALMPTKISSDHADDFRASLRALDLGTVQVSAMTYPSLESRRTANLIRRSDPEQYQVTLTLRGHQRITQFGRDTVLGRHDLMIYDSSRPFHAHVAAQKGGTLAVILAQVPKLLFPLPANRVDQVLAARISGDGVGALLAQFFVRLAKDAAHYRPSDASRLGIVLLDLAVALVAHELDAGSLVPPESHRRALALRVRAFIRQHIGDPRLTPGVIAAAHHISLRHLHRLFQDQGISVAAWIRSQRLEGCQRDLADPALRSMPIHTVAARWGFSHPAVFSRAFRDAYGLSPRDYRQQALGCGAAVTEPGQDGVEGLEGKKQ